MEVKLLTKPKSPVIIEGFPGFGLVGTIATEFLIRHLDAKLIGWIRMEEVPPIIAVHKGEPLEPLGIFYDKKTNILILHALSNVAGFEWDISEIIARLAKELKAKEVISLEGVGSREEVIETRGFYISKNKKFKIAGIDELKEGIIVGVTGALLLRRDVNVSCIFAETHTQLPDSRAAAKIIEVLDKYLGLDVDYKPLIKKADEFETKLKSMMEQAQTASANAERKRQTYFG